MRHTGHGAELDRAGTALRDGGRTSGSWDPDTATAGGAMSKQEGNPFEGPPPRHESRGGQGSR